MIKKHRKFCRVFSYIDHSLIVISTITGCVFISAFASLVSIPVGFESSTIGLKNCLITAGIKKYKSIIQIKKKKHLIVWIKITTFFKRRVSMIL